MKKSWFLTLCILFVSTGLVLAKETRISPVAFTLANSGASTMSGFSLAATSGGPMAIAGGEIIEDSGPPFNTALGYHALGSNVEGYKNTAIGYQAMNWNYIGTSNTAIGYQAMYYNNAASMNTAVGMHALYNNQNGGWNTAIGHSAMFKRISGNSNTAIGKSALQDAETGQSNTAIGTFALNSLTDGYSNIALGHMAGGELIEGDHNVYIYRSDLPESESNTIRIGSPYDPNQWVNQGQNQTFIAGIVENPFIADDSPSVVGINSEGQLGTVSSDLLPEGPQGPMGPQVPEGPAGEGLISGSLLLLPSGFEPPTGYTLLGTTSFIVNQSDNPRFYRLTVNIYQKE